MVRGAVGRATGRSGARRPRRRGVRTRAVRPGPLPGGGRRRPARAGPVARARRAGRTDHADQLAAADRRLRRRAGRGHRRRRNPALGARRPAEGQDPVAATAVRRRTGRAVPAAPCQPHGAHLARHRRPDAGRDRRGRRRLAGGRGPHRPGTVAADQGPGRHGPPGSVLGRSLHVRTCHHARQSAQPGGTPQAAAVTGPAVGRRRGTARGPLARRRRHGTAQRRGAHRTYLCGRYPAGAGRRGDGQAWPGGRRRGTAAPDVRRTAVRPSHRLGHRHDAVGTQRSRRRHRGTVRDRPALPQPLAT